MLYNHSLYISTDSFYSVPKYEDYFEERNQHLKKFDIDYLEKNTREKWPFLLKELAESLQEADMPDLSIEDFRNMLGAFKRKREETSNSLFNLSLDQCVNYFEEFLFLYTTEDPRYQLKPAAKKNLLLSIKEAMGVCETGINGRFYTALQDHRKDGNWIQDELSKARSTALHHLHQLYGGEDVHTYNQFVVLANKERLGIVAKEELLDIHVTMVNTGEISAFFYKEYPGLFETYEKDTINNLTNHYLSELASILSIRSADWVAGELSIPSARAIDLKKSIDGHFGGVMLDNIMHELGELSEDSTMFTLKIKQEFVQIIKRLVTEKLVVDGYYVNLDAAAENREGHKNLRLINGTRFDELIAAHQALTQDDAQRIEEALSHNLPILANYPELVLSHIQSNPDILSILPRFLKTDTRFLDATTTILDEMLVLAVIGNNINDINKLTEQLLNVIQPEYSYVRKLSKQVVENPTVRARLLKVEDTVLHTFLTEFGSEDEIELKRLLLDLRKNFSDAFTSTPSLPPILLEEVPLYQVAADVRCMQACAALLEHNVTLQSLSEHVNKITPHLLLGVINERAIKKLPPLPLFDKGRTFNDLNQFIQEIESQLIPGWRKDYLSIRRQACEHENFAYIHDPYHKRNAVTFLSKTNDWFLAFHQYHVYQSSSEKVWSLLLTIGTELFGLVFGLLKVALLCSLFVIAVSVLSPIYTAYNGYIGVVFFLNIGLLLLNSFFIGSALLSTATDIIWRLVLLDVEIYLTLLIPIVLEGISVISKTFNVLKATYGVLDTFISIITRNDYHSERLEDTCENILLRLYGIDEASAQEKAEVLTSLLSQIKAELIKEPEHSFNQLLEQEYPVGHRGHEYTISFLEAASTRREHQGGFKLDQASGRMCFFSRSTTSQSLIESSEQPIVRLV